MTAPPARARPLAALHAAFLAMAPRIERHGRIHMRGLKRGDDLEEAVAEMVALSWKWFLRLVTRILSAAEQAGTPPARELLTRLAGGAAEARLTRDAKASLARLVGRPAAAP